VYRLSAQEPPALVSTLKFSSLVKRLIRFGNRIFALGVNGQIYVVDMQNIEDPLLVKTIAETEYPTYFMRQGDYSYYFTFNGYLRVFDTPISAVMNPRTPVELKKYSGQFVPSDDKSVLTYLGPVTEQLPQGTAEHQVWNVSGKVSDVISWQGEYVMLDADGGVSFFRQDEKTGLQFIRRLDLSKKHRWLAASDSRLYVGGDDVDIIAAKGDNDFVVTGHLKTRDGNSYDGLVVDNSLCVAAGRNGLLLFSLDNPDQPEPLPKPVIPDHLLSQIDARQVTAKGQKRVLIAAGPSGLIELELKGRSGSLFSGYLGFDRPIYAIDAVGDFCLLSDGEAVHVVDISMAGSLQKLGQVGLPGIEKFAAVADAHWAAYSHSGGWYLLPPPRFAKSSEISRIQAERSLAGHGSERYSLSVFDYDSVVRIPGTLSLSETGGGDVTGGIHAVQ